MVPQLPASQFRAWLEANSQASPVVLDVREPWEWQTASVRPEGFELLALSMHEIPARLAELPQDRPMACLCHHGMRSLHVAHYLQSHGFADVVNLQGGIDAWSCELDTSVPRY